MKRTLKVRSAAILVAFALSACATPEPVRDLANKTAANVTQVGSHLKALSATSESVARARARNVARLKATVREVRKRHTLDIALIKISGDTESITRVGEIMAWMTEARAAARGMTVAEFEEAPKEDAVDPVSADVKTVMVSLESLDSKTTALGQFGKTLAALSNRDDLKARAKFLIGYVQEVRAEVDNKREPAAAAAEAAKTTAAGAASGAATEAAAKK